MARKRPVLLRDAGPLMREARLDRGWDLERAAHEIWDAMRRRYPQDHPEDLEVRGKQYGAWERSENTIPSPYLPAIQDALGIPVHLLLGMSDPDHLSARERRLVTMDRALEGEEIRRFVFVLFESQLRASQALRQSMQSTGATPPE